MSHAISSAGILPGHGGLKQGDGVGGGESVQTQSLWPLWTPPPGLESTP